MKTTGRRPAVAIGEDSRERGHVVASAVHDYTEVRPHGSLKGAIPLERYLNPGFTPAPPDLKAARAQRIEENRKTNCRLERKGPECRS